MAKKRWFVTVNRVIVETIRQSSEMEVEAKTERKARQLAEERARKDYSPHTPQLCWTNLAVHGDVETAEARDAEALEDMEKIAIEDN